MPGSALMHDRMDGGGLDLKLLLFLIKAALC